MKLERSVIVNSLVVALAAGTALLVVVTDEQPTTLELESRAKNLLPSFSRDDFRSLSVKTARASFALEPRTATASGGTRYELRADGTHEADPEAVEALLRTLELAGFVRRLEAGEEDRVALGLDEPRGELELAFKRSSAQLLIGKEAKTPAGTSYVEVREGGSKPSVYLVRSSFVGEILVESDALRVRNLLPYSLSELEQIRWQDGATTIQVRRAGGPDFLGADGKRVSRSAVERLGLELARAKSVRFIEPSKASAALQADPALLTVQVTPRAGKPLVAFRVGGQCPEDPALEVLLRSAPNASAECVPGGVRQIFRETASALRDESPFALRTDEVEGLRIERGEKALELTRHESAFKLLAPSAAGVELEAGNAKIDALVSARGEPLQSPNLEALGLARPAGRARLRSSTIEGTPTFEETVQVGALQPDGRLPIRRMRDGVVLLLGHEAASAYKVDSALLKSRTLFDFGFSELSSLTILSGGERQRLRREGDTFELAEPKGHRHDGGLVLDLVQALGTLRADRWVSESAEPAHGLADPTAVLELELSKTGQDPRKVQLTIGSNTPGGAFAALSDQPGVFLLPRSFVTLATTLVLSRAVFEVDPKAVALFSLEAGNRSLELRRTGDGFSSAESNLAPAALERLIEALSNLRPEAALRTGPARKNEGFARPVLILRVTPIESDRKPRVLRIGASDTIRSSNIFYARVDGIDATYLISHRAVRDVLDNLEE